MQGVVNGALQSATQVEPDRRANKLQKLNELLLFEVPERS